MITRTLLVWSVFLGVNVCIAGDPCKEWFQRSKLKPGKGCQAKCSSLPTGLGTFSCPDKCQEFCVPDSEVQKLLTNLVYYPGLTLKEKELIIKHPKEAVLAFIQKEKAQHATLGRFGRDAEDDESDAFRHFVWAALMVGEIGSDLTKEFLDAHEYGHVQDAGSAMDLANNRAGLIAGERLVDEGKLSQSEIENTALDQLRNKVLVVLRPRGGPK